jgi:hypothetical protein
MTRINSVGWAAPNSNLDEILSKIGEETSKLLYSQFKDLREEPTKLVRVCDLRETSKYIKNALEILEVELIAFERDYMEADGFHFLMSDFREVFVYCNAE